MLKLGLVTKQQFLDVASLDVVSALLLHILENLRDHPQINEAELIDVFLPYVFKEGVP